MNNSIHAFERAGLGKAPFRLVNMEIKHYQACHGAPLQPGGACEYCGTGIVECCTIADVNGKTFVVGNVCVGKTGDRGLIDIAKRKLNALRLEMRHKREEERIANAKGLLSREDISNVLAEMPHPMNWPNMSALSYCQFLMKNAGNAGMIRAARIIESAKSLQGRGENE
jgi:hypothetical protein